MSRSLPESYFTGHFPDLEAEYRSPVAPPMPAGDAGHTVPDHPLAELRDYDPAVMYQEAMTGYVTVAYCPRCRCRKSGDVEVANNVDGEVCDDGHCPCHDEDE